MSLLGTRNHIDCGAAAQLCNQHPPTGEKTGLAVYFDACVPETPFGGQLNTFSRCTLIRTGHKAGFKVGAQASRGSVAVTARNHSRRARKKQSGTRCRTTARDYAWSATTSQLDGTSGGFPSTERRSWTCAARVVPPISRNCAKAQRAVQQATPGMIAQTLYPWRPFHVCPICDRRRS
jgi:hypothetical protein